ncbi:MAG TPA: Gfo/Idh/MocA family oxidoreductase [Candidatus Polarisedimenticolia bacterium]|jgi:predicted dehydrogenase|nr:Gfo/Idh/MocA family oxidoreductase [Candidatus Polarisedimenticolia bacterium]
MAIRIAVIGVGYLGRHHARLLHSLPEAELCGVVDADPARARAVAAEFATRSYLSLDDLPPDLQAATIAVPTAAHRSVAVACLKRGWSVMVEKPLAASPREGKEIVQAAEQAGRILQVGHTERYNPALRASVSRILRPRFVEAHRLGTFAARSLDVDVILDLMIHDLDLVRSFDPSPVVSVAAVGVQALTDKMDIANARIQFESGCVANLTASRISTDRVRKIRIFQNDSYLGIDTAAQEVACYRLDRQGGSPRIVQDTVPVAKDEPLRVELASFLEAVAHRRRPIVSGEDGLAALELAERVRSVLREGGT